MKRKIRVLMVHSSDELYGADRALLELARRLDRAAFEVTVVVPNDIPYQGLLSQELVRNGITCQKLKLGVLRRRYFTPIGFLQYLGFLFISTLQLVWLVRQRHIDVVHSNTTAVFGGALAARLTRRRHIWHVHEIVKRPRSLAWTTARLLFWLSDAIVAVSQAALDHVAAIYPGNRAKGVVIYNGLDTASYVSAVDGADVRASLGFGAQDVVMGIVGRIHPGKGHAEFLEAAARVAQVVPSARFLVVGDPFVGRQHLLQALREQAHALGIAERVVFSPFRDDIPRVMRSLDILALPTTHPESFGLTALEAMAAGRAVVASAQGGPLEVVQDGVTGLLVRPGDVQGLADALISLAQCRELRQQMGQAGQKRVLEIFSIERMVQRFEDLYLRVVT